MRCNTATFKATDGTVLSLPLQELIKRNAVIARRVNGEPLAHSVGGTNQLWIPGMPAKYFVRDIAEISFTEEKQPPRIEEFEDDGRDYTNRPNISVTADYVCKLGSSIEFSGYASDFDRAIVAIQFSLDEGVHWTEFKTEHAVSEKWVYWSFEFCPKEEGRYCMKVRSVNDLGKPSPHPASHFFDVIG